MMKKKKRAFGIVKILSVKQATRIDMTQYINKAVKAINITTLKNILVDQLPKREAKVRNMYDYGDCLA